MRRSTRTCRCDRAATVELGRDGDPASFEPTRLHFELAGMRVEHAVVHALDLRNDRSEHESIMTRGCGTVLVVDGRDRETRHWRERLRCCDA